CAMSGRWTFFDYW
nr:immunoglobulin heavy chain junction region [Macaca mulatta]MOW19059.1 immunoglobulin heavy chain junction region [Macaca mulatta]MOW19667.1 immunoglobulin heavy chain junction region [Macaca mulatta]MOW19878.1 immunoglobulin heavy chain junction region [Macaca mulatta]MOW22235.1 immunoglobulin heavy chain junction region [Macaca mulatta]